MRIGTLNILCVLSAAALWRTGITKERSGRGARIAFSRWTERKELKNERNVFFFFLHSFHLANALIDIERAVMRLREA